MDLDDDDVAMHVLGLRAGHRVLCRFGSFTSRPAPTSRRREAFTDGNQKSRVPGIAGTARAFVSDTRFVESARAQKILTPSATSKMLTSADLPLGARHRPGVIRVIVVKELFRLVG